jgi:hypothetical protein
MIPSGDIPIYEVVKYRRGKVVYVESTTLSLMKSRYNQWRIRWCTIHPNATTPSGFREGLINREVLKFSFEKGFWRYLHGSINN